MATVAITGFEREVIRILVGSQLDSSILSDLSEADLVEHTGAGYFLTISDDRLPQDRRVFSKPLLIGRSESVECGFVCFCEKGQLTLECHAWGELDIPRDIRSQPIRITPAA